MDIGGEQAFFADAEDGLIDPVEPNIPDPELNVPPLVPPPAPQTVLHPPPPPVQPAPHLPPPPVPPVRTPVVRTPTLSANGSRSNDRSRVDQPSIERVVGCQNIRIDENLQRKKNNWDAWGQSIFIIFDLAEVTGYVEGSIAYPDPARDPAGARNWRYNDTYAKMLIINNVGSSEKTHIRGCQTSHKMWENLRLSYQSTHYLVNTDKFRALCGFRAAEGTDIPDHLMKIKDKWDELTFYRKQHNIILSDRFFKCLVAALLPRSWDEFTRPYVEGYIDDEVDDPKRLLDSQQFMSIIKQEYEYNETRKKGELPALANRIAEDDPNKKKPDASKKRHCQQCGRDGHKTLKCRFLGQSKCPSCSRFHDGQSCWPGNSKRPIEDENSANASRKRRKKDANNAEEEDENVQSNVAVQGNSYSLNADANEMFTYDQSSNGYFDQAYEWIADTGTTSHITNRRDAFTTYDYIPDSPIKGVGETQVSAIARGTVYVQSEVDGLIHIFELKNTLHIPANRNNLFSLGKWDRQNRSFYVQNGILHLIDKEGEDVARGTRLANNLYRMAFKLLPQNINEDEVISLIADASMMPWEVWHRRMGHVSYSGMRESYVRDQLTGFDLDPKTPKRDCIPCIEGKLHVTPYGPASNKPRNLGELTHVDLWGKYDNASINGNRYFVLMIDDASRHITIRFLK